MRKPVKYALVGAAFGCVGMTIFATDEMLGSPDAPEETWIVVGVALAFGGLLLGAPGGAFVGLVLAGLRAIVRYVKTRQEVDAPAPLSYAPPNPTYATAPPTPAPTKPTQPTPTPTPTVSPEQRAAVAEAATRQGQRAGHAAPAPLAPITPAPQRPAAPERVDQSDPERLNRVLAKLDALIGLESVAEQVREYAQRVAFEQQRAEALGVEVSKIGMHSLFVGPPGVAKTSVARIWGEAMCALGMLPTDRVVEVGRSDLVGEHIGSTAAKTRAKLEEAGGGVFFLDEAYTLAPKTQQDFGPEAVAELLTYMENNRGKICVIADGYEDKMEAFLDTNPGLASRFSERVTFSAYDAATLVEITAGMAAEGRDEITGDGRETLLRGYQRLVAAPPKEWGNARSAKEVLNAARTARAVRVGVGQHDRETMTTLTGEDMRAGLEKKFPQAV